MAARETMDPELQRTVREGDVENLRKLCVTRSHEFFLTREVSSYNRNMLHFILIYGKSHPAFLKEALEILPIPVVRQLICQSDSNGNNSLHRATDEDTNVRLLVDAYNRSSDVVVGDDLPSCPPWRAKNRWGDVPAEYAISCKSDEVAVFLISVDPEIFKFVDAGKLLRESILKGCIRTVNVILTSDYGYFIEGFDRRYINKKCLSDSDEPCISLLQHHPEIANYLDHSGKTEVLHRATWIGAVDVVKTILNIDISNSYPLLIGRGDYNYNNPLYIAVKRGYLEIAHLILDAFNKSRERQAQEERLEAAVRSNSRIGSSDIEEVSTFSRFFSFQPWSLVDRTGQTPLTVALFGRHRKLAVDMLYSDFALLSDLVDIYDEKPAIIPAMEQLHFKDYIKCHMKHDDDQNWIMDVYVEAFLRFVREISDDNKSIKLINQLPTLTRFKDASGRPMLQYLLDESNVDGMSLVLKIHPSAIDPPDAQDEHLLIRACRKGNMSAIRAICDLFPNCPKAAICQDQTTVLHNVRLENLKEYRSLLHIPEIARLNNKTDAFGRSPLIKAIKDDNIYLSQALLEMDDIDVMDIKSKEGKTAAVLLLEKSKQSVEWDVLYKKAKQATSYIPLGTDLKEMRSTLSVVAALITTITFAAAFTVPGGFDQNKGDVLLGRKASFIVFILSNTYAMCCSMIVLYSLIWSMVWDSNKALLLIDRSVFVLQQSLYGALVAFMTGVYTMMSHKSLWVAIVVCVMSSFVSILANRRILVTVLDKFVPTSRTESSQPRPAESSIDPTLSAETSMGPRMSAISVQR